MTTDATEPPATVSRARIEQVRPLAAAYLREHDDAGVIADPPLPSGGIYWIAEHTTSGEPLGYAAATLRPSGCTIGPIYTVPDARRRGIGNALLEVIQRWATDTRVPVVEISVPADNDAGRSFLESLGYEPRRILMSLTPIRDDQR